jgi:hypothetical protein
MAAEKDDYRVQRARIERIVKELCSTCTVEYDPDRTPNWIRFRVVNSNGTLMAVTSGDREASEIADKSDSWIREYLKHISGGKL